MSSEGIHCNTLRLNSGYEKDKLEIRVSKTITFGLSRKFGWNFGTSCFKSSLKTAVRPLTARKKTIWAPLYLPMRKKPKCSRFSEQQLLLLLCLQSGNGLYVPQQFGPPPHMGAAEVFRNQEGKKIREGHYQK